MADLPPLKINFCDFFIGWDKLDNDFTNILRTRYDVIISDKPDFLIYSCSGNAHRWVKDCIKIFSTAENIHPDFNKCDYSIGFDDWDCGDRHLHFPCWMYSLCHYDPTRTQTPEELLNRRFCNFVYRNASSGAGTSIRQEFCKKLMARYKHVDCPGEVLHNTDLPIAARGNRGWIPGKIEFIKNYKFTLAFENEYNTDYVTEKLFHPFCSRSVPIYFGATNLKYFNPKAFINVADYESFDAAIDRVIELDQDDTQYLAMVNEDPFVPGFNLNQFERFNNFLFSIVEAGMVSRSAGSRTTQEWVHRLVLQERDIKHPPR